MSNRSIIRRVYYEIQVTSISPISITSGVSGETDADVLRDREGACFIPGTSLAGAFRNYLGDRKDTRSIYGFAKDQDGSISSVFISDLRFTGKAKNVVIRDRVALDRGKGVDNKFDLETLETGASGCICLEVVERQGDAFDFDGSIDHTIHGIQNGDIRFGAYKNRGYGRLRIDRIKSRTFRKADREAWAAFLGEDKAMPEEGQTFAEWSREHAPTKERYLKFRVPLKLEGGISIRKYSAKPGQADYEHITSNGVPVIPGTSWNGAIRAAARQILIDCGLTLTDAEELIKEWFGQVKDGGDSRQSEIVFSESVIKGARTAPMVRNQINRFTAGTSDGALYTELACFRGHTVLEYMIRNREDMMTAALQGILSMVVQDLEQGMVAVGGQVAIGRGIFSGNDQEERSQLASDDCMRALYDVIEERRKNHAGE